jgi:hypothetical protein
MPYCRRRTAVTETSLVGDAGQPAPHTRYVANSE